MEVYRDGYAELFAEAAGIVAPSRAMRERLIEMGAPEARTHSIPCGVDVAAFVPGDPAREPPLFLAVGRFVEKKGQGLTIAAFAEVCREHPSARLRMIGGGRDLDECRRLVASLGIDSLVRFDDGLPHDDVRRAMREARAFVQHSVVAADGDREGTPVAILEAAACGLPIVATRHEGIRDAVVDCETGFLVDEHDTRAMAARMVELALDPELAARLGAAGRRRVVEKFSLDRSIGRLSAVIEAAIDGVSPAAEHREGARRDA